MVLLKKKACGNRVKKKILTITDSTLIDSACTNSICGAQNNILSVIRTVGCFRSIFSAGWYCFNRLTCTQRKTAIRFVCRYNTAATADKRIAITGIWLWSARRSGTFLYYYWPERIENKKKPFFSLQSTDDRVTRTVHVTIIT